MSQANMLMEKLARAKKVMDKVDSKNYSTGNIDPNIITQNTDFENMSAPQPLHEYHDIPKPISAPASLSTERINNSKLPDHIKKAMIEKPIPIPNISLNENNINMDIIKGAKRLIEQDNGKPKSKVESQTNNSIKSNSNIDMNSLSMLIENVVRKVLDEKLNQILMANETKSINENLVLKVGDSIFKGKITGVNNSK